MLRCAAHSRNFCGTFKGIGLKKVGIKYLFALELVLLKGENNSGHAHKTGPLNHLLFFLFLKISYENPCPF